MGNTDEGTADEGAPVVEEIKPDASGKYPETVTWKQYVATKETIGNKLEAEKTKVQGLEEKLKSVVTAEDHKKVADELVDANKKLTDFGNKDKVIQELALTEMRTALTKKGVPEDKVKGMSASELSNMILVLDVVKPKPDLSGGGGGEAPSRPKDQIKAGFEGLHPTK